MTKKIDLYAKFIQNEQKRLNNSTVVAPRPQQINEVAPIIGGLALRGAVWAAKKMMQKAAEKQAAKAAAEKAAAETAKKAGEEVAKKAPENIVLQGTRKVPTKPHYKPGAAEPAPAPTVSPSASQALPKPRPEYKPEPSNLGPAVLGAAGLAGGAAAIKKGTEERKEVEAERAPKQETPAMEPSKKEPPKAETSPEPSKPETAAEAPKSSEEDEEAEKYVAPIERRYRSIKKESLERFINMQKPRVPNSSKFSNVFTEQEAVKAQPVKAKPVSDEVKAEPVKSGTELDSELEDMPGTDPKERGAKFQPVTRSPEYMDYLRQNQEKIIAAKRAREEAGAFKSKIQASSTSADVDSL